jgi:hypothetical protein
MTTSIQFDLNSAYRNWREKLQQSPHFRSENLDELESHLRDSVNVLQTKGLTADEAFMIGTRRVGTAEALEEQFAAQNGGRGGWHALRRFAHKYKNHVLHLAVLAYFTFGCWLLWACLHLSQMIEPAAARAYRLAQVDFGGAPAFTRLFWGLMPYWYVPPIVAMVYCGVVWTRKGGARSSWFAFFSVVTAFLFIFLVPILIANQLPLIQFLNSIPAKTFEAQH